MVPIPTVSVEKTLQTELSDLWYRFVLMCLNVHAFTRIAIREVQSESLLGTWTEETISLPLDETARRIKTSSKPPERNGWARIAKKRMSRSGENAANPQRKKPILELSKKYPEGEVNCFRGKPSLLWRWMLGVVKYCGNLLGHHPHGGMQKQIRVGRAGSFQE